MIGCPRTDPDTHPVEGWCPVCPRVVMYRKITAREKRRGYVYARGHIESVTCRIYLSGLGNVYESDGGAAFIIDGCAHVAFVGAL